MDIRIQNQFNNLYIITNTQDDAPLMSDDAPLIEAETRPKVCHSHVNIYFTNHPINDVDNRNSGVPKLYNHPTHVCTNWLLKARPGCEKNTAGLLKQLIEFDTRQLS